MDSDLLKEQVAKISWFHTMNLGNGIITPGVDDTPKKLLSLGIPSDLSGKSVLDIGAWNGFFSFEAERRGAARVVALDSYCWSGEGWGTKEGFDLARRALASKVEDTEMEVLDISPEKIGTFDLVLFLGVLYHMKYPLLVLEKVASVTREQLILETEVDLCGLMSPAAAFYAGDELNKDNTNWWAPNPRALIDMLKVVGFKRVHVVRAPRPWLYRLCRAFKEMLQQGKSVFQELGRDRMVVHAWKE